MKRFGFACLAGCILGLAVHVAAQTNKVQSISLEEAVRMALEHNLSVQIQRFNPLLDRFALEANYGAYDASFNSSAKDTYTAQPGQIFNGLQSPSQDVNDHNYTMGIGGINGSNALTPWGLQYNLGVSLDRSAYTRFDSNGVPLAPFTQNKTFAGLTLDQPLLKNFWIDTTRATILIAKKTLQYDELAFRQLVNTNISAVEQAYDELNYAFENVKVQEEAVALADQLVSENKRKVQAGVLTVLDVSQSLSQLASARAALLAARQLVMTDENNLKALITDRYRQMHDIQLQPADKLVAVPQVFDLQESWQTGLAKRPDVLAARVNQERADINRRLQKNQLFPQLDLTGSYGRSGLSSALGGAYDQIPRNDYPSYSYGMILSFPLSNKGARNNYKAAKAAIQQAQLEYQLAEQTMLIQVQNTIESARSDLAQVDATREARVYAEQALAAEEKKLQVGTSTPFVVLQLQSNLTTARSAEIRALADYNEALAQLAQFEGTILDKHHLTVRIY
jgi:outer membrane protein TolC